MRHGENRSKHTPPVSTGGVYYVPMANSKTPAETTEPTEEVTGYGYLTDAEREEAIAAHAKTVAENTK